MSHAYKYTVNNMHMYMYKKWYNIDFLQLVDSAILKVFKTQYSDDDLYNESRSIPDETQLHFIYQDLRTRLQLFSQALALKPEMLELMTSNVNNALTQADEMVHSFSLCLYEVFLNW